MAKKKIVGNIIELDLPPTPEATPVLKKKREISSTQRENLSKGMAVLKARREAKLKSTEVVEPIIEPTPPPVVAPPSSAVAQEPTPKTVKERKPRVVKNYLTTEDFNSFKSELLTTLKPVSEYKPTVQPVVQPVVHKERVISGRELLDKIFFK